MSLSPSQRYCGICTHASVSLQGVLPSEGVLTIPSRNTETMALCVLLLAATLALGAHAESWTLANGFTVTLNGDDSVMLAAANGNLAWQSAAPPFLAVAAVALELKGHDGMFKVSQDVACETAAQSALTARVLPSKAGVVLSGTVLGGTGACAAGVGFELTLATTAASAHQIALTVALTNATALCGAPGSDDANSLPACRMALRAALPAEDEVMGFGEQYSVWDMRGRIVPLLVSEQGIGRGLEPLTAALNLLSDGQGGNWHTTYAALPHYVTASLQSVFFNQSAYAEFDLTTSGMLEARVGMNGEGERGGRAQRDRNMLVAWA